MAEQADKLRVAQLERNKRRRFFPARKAQPNATETRVLEAGAVQWSPTA